MEIRKKRLAVVCGLYDGGTEIAMVRLLERLDYHDVDVTLITQDPSGPIEPRIPITMFGRPRWSGPGRRFRYDFPALSSMIRGVLSPGTGTPDDR